jgi:hypothetical protein
MGKPRIAGISAVLAFALFLAGCGNGEAPAGRWEGFSESAQWLIAVRLQVDPGNKIHATALSVSVEGASLPRRMELETKIKSALTDQWPQAVVGKIDYKDGTITKAGGYAPLFVFEPKSRTMTFYFYAGGKLTERIKLYPVRAFADAA